jgi:hypothetical protein
MYTFRQITSGELSFSQREINGKWVPARPMVRPFWYRLKDAWRVLIGKADAFTWPEEQ